MRIPWIFLCFALLAVALAARPAAAQGPAAEPEHLPRASRPPVSGVRPSALPAYGERLGVPARSDADRAFDRIVDEFLLFDLRLDPVRATNLGVHDYDALLPATDSTSIATSIQVFDAFLSRFDTLDVNSLGRERLFDRALLRGRIQGALLERRTIRTWVRDPRFYLSIATGSLDALLERDYAPLEDRDWNVVARLVEIPRMLRNGRANLENPPRLYTEVAIEQAAELIDFLSNQLPVRVAPLRDPVLNEEFDHHLYAAVTAAIDYHEWLKSDLLRRSNGALSPGAQTYADLLRYDERVTTPLDSLRRRGEAALRQTQSEMEEAANAIEPGLSVREALARMAREGPIAGELVPASEAALEGVRQFLVTHAILTPGGPDRLTVSTTPAFERALAFASMDAPGVLETGSAVASLYVTPPDARWPKERQADHLGHFNRFQLGLIAIHEGIPGLYAHALAARNCPSLARALFPSAASREGWANYCEEMMLAEGFGSEDPRYRLAQLDRSLQRECEGLVELALHRRGISYDDATLFFEREGYRPHADAVLAARRCLSTTGAFLPLLGKWEILDLREEMRRVQGEGFRLREFHDRILTYGGAPIALQREH